MNFYKSTNRLKLI